MAKLLAWVSFSTHSLKLDATLSANAPVTSCVCEESVPLVSYQIGHSQWCLPFSMRLTCVCVLSAATSASPLSALARCALRWSRCLRAKLWKPQKPASKSTNPKLHNSVSLLCPTDGQQRLNPMCRWSPHGPWTHQGGVQERPQWHWQLHTYSNTLVQEVFRSFRQQHYWSIHTTSKYMYNLIRVKVQ